MKSKRYQCLLVTPLVCVTMLLNCGIYSFKGSLPPHLNTVAVPLFNNRTAEFGVTEEITDIVIDEFTRDGSLKIIDQENADVLIEGTILSIQDRAGAFTSQEQVEDIKVYISVHVVCTDRVKRLEMWDERLTQYGGYDPAQGPSAREDAYAEAIEKISQEILNKTVSNW